MNANTFKSVQRTLLNLAVIAALGGLSGSAIAVPDGSELNQAFVEQVGVANEGNTNQAYGTFGNMAAVVQIGPNLTTNSNKGTVNQESNNNYAYIHQGNFDVWAMNNSATITQTGEGSHADVTQTNQLSTVTVNQFQLSTATVTQDGSGGDLNEVTINQTGSGDQAEAYQQTGASGNVATITQNANSQYGFVSQQGSYNHATINQ